MAATPSGSAVLLWSRDSGSLYASVRPAGNPASFGAPELIDASATWSGFTSVAMDPVTGRVLAAYVTNQPNHVVIATRSPTVR